MDVLYFGLFCLILSAVMSVIGGILKKKRGGSEKFQTIMEEFRKNVNGMLEENETVEALCGYNPCAAVTNKRLLMGTKKGIEVVQFSEIRKLSGLNGAGNKTMDPSRMLVFEIKANKKYVLGNHSEGFDQVVEALVRRAGR